MVVVLAAEVAGIVVAEVVHRSESEHSPVAIPAQRSCVVAEWVAAVAVVFGTSAARAAGIVGIAVDTAVLVAMLARPGMKPRMFLAMGQSP